MEAVKEYVERMWRARSSRSKGLTLERSRATCSIKIKIKSRCQGAAVTELSRQHVIRHHHDLLVDCTKPSSHVALLTSRKHHLPLSPAAPAVASRIAKFAPPKSLSGISWGFWWCKLGNPAGSSDKVVAGEWLEKLGTTGIHYSALATISPCGTSQLEVVWCF
ncbi:hypothetical protein E2C01_062384 [Portunus trituberculatus]|uniref:Uncharacterized protein n=1 Tax=Portunus trituberculatus TaxID=210409 RepID=A0A5B7HFX0_PORTR|nr:hypothetical protein [Portunus trituberculatus]